MAFTHLHVHTEHSELDGLTRITAGPKRAKALGLEAHAITDHGDLSGALAHQKACLAEGIKPIIGCEFYMAIGSRFEKNSEVVPNDDDTVSDADEGKEKVKRYMHLTVLARNEIGWKSLLALHNKAEDSFWFKPRIDFDLLDEHGEGLIILTGCLGGPVAGPLARAGAADKAGDPETAEQYRNEARANLDRLVNAVGKEHVFLEVMYHGIGAEAHAFREIRALSEETGIPLVATNDCHYEHGHDHGAHDAFLAVGVKKALDEPARFRFNGTPDYYIKSEEEMLAVLGNIKNEEAAAAWRQACANTQLVVDLVADRTIPEGRQRLPKFPVPEGEGSAKDYLYKLVKAGAKEHCGGKITQEVADRLKEELYVINEMGFADYFLITWDMIAWARSDYMPQDWIAKVAGKPVDEVNRKRKKPILVGPGRGSAAGSRVSYDLGIVGIDPLEYHLLFERFLELGRDGMPDIDVDFEQGRRGEVLRYLQMRWGKANVAHIGTIGYALSKAAIKDAARVLKPTQLPEEVLAEIVALETAGEYAEARKQTAIANKAVEAEGDRVQRLGNMLATLVPTAGGKAAPFRELMDPSNSTTEDFRNLVEREGETAQEILELAMQLEGVAKAKSIHPCGFIISPEPLDELVPMRWASHAANADPDAPRVITWNGGECEDLGLLKNDVLGLMNLDIASTAMDYVADVTGRQLTLDTIPHPNTKGDPVVEGAYRLLGRGQTAGVFQMESDGMKRVSQDVAPETLEDISAIVALYRPGPLGAGMDKTYAARKGGDEPVSYDAFTRDPVESEWINKVLGDDYGMAIYQETIMRLSTVVSGFDAAQRSRLRRAMGKKNQSEMDACFEMWLDGAPKEFLDDDGEMISPVFSTTTAKKLWDFISYAASYLFNKSHSAAYGQLAYVTAYLKAGWPVEYGAAILAVADKDEKRHAALEALREDGIEVLAPDVNESRSATAPVNGRVRIGLSEIKGVGSTGKYIVAERDANGPFASLHDLISRVKVANPKAESVTQIPATALQALIEAGALDSLGSRLGHIMVMRAAQKAEVAPIDAAWDPVEASTRQRLRLGVAMGTHPMVSAAAEIKNWTSPHGYEHVRGMSRISDKSGDPFLVAGVIAGWSEKAAKSGRLASIVLESPKLSLPGVVWSRTLTRLRDNDNIPKIGDIVAVSGTVKVREVSAGGDGHEGDGGDDVDETITVKELTVSELWPIVRTSDPEINEPAPVISFADHYLRLRSVPKPSAKPKATPAKEPKSRAKAVEPVEEPVPVPANDQEDNLIVLDEHRPAREPRTFALRMKGLWERGVKSSKPLGETLDPRHTDLRMPELKKLAAGSVIQGICVNGDRIVAVFASAALSAEDILKVVPEQDSPRWNKVTDDSCSQDVEWSLLSAEAAGEAAA